VIPKIETSSRSSGQRADRGGRTAERLPLNSIASWWLWRLEGNPERQGHRDTIRAWML